MYPYSNTHVHTHITHSYSPHKLSIIVPLYISAILFASKVNQPSTQTQLGICHSCLDLWSQRHPIAPAPPTPYSPSWWHLSKCTLMRFVTNVSTVEVGPHREGGERWGCFHTFRVLVFCLSKAGSVHITYNISLECLIHSIWNSRKFYINWN